MYSVTKILTKALFIPHLRHWSIFFSASLSLAVGELLTFKKKETKFVNLRRDDDGSLVSSLRHWSIFFSANLSLAVGELLTFVKKRKNC
jgi:hypothetical protein